MITWAPYCAAVASSSRVPNPPNPKDMPHLPGDLKVVPVPGPRDNGAVPHAFPWFGTSDYWRGQVQMLEEQLEAMDEPVLAV